MKFIIVLTTLVSSLLLMTTCGGDGDDGGKPPAAREKPVFNPWSAVGGASLPEGVVTDSVRVLNFGDGMTVSYDGSDEETGAEEVCRRTSSGEFHYEVCMPLEDDPFYVEPEVNALVWHPLFFDRFATDLTCRSWREGQDSKTEEDCGDVMPRFGGENFNCEAGLVNGDKALRCSDEWAVVVNGDTDDAKTVCRVHLRNGSGRCLGAPKTRMVTGTDGTETEVPVPDAELILEMQRTSWEGYGSGQDNSKQFAAGETVVAVVPQDLPAKAVLSYRSRDENFCTVDSDDSDGGIGTVVINGELEPPFTCKIILKIESTGFADRVLFAQLPVLKANDTAWADYTLSGDIFYPGERLAAGTVTHSDPASPRLTYSSLDESVCTVDENGNVEAVSAGACTVRLTAVERDYLDVVIEKSITVTALNNFSEIAWSFPSTAVVGVDSAAIPAPVVRDVAGEDVTDGDLVVAINVKSGDCSYDDATAVLSFTDITECVAEVTASGVRGYSDYAAEFSVTPTEGNLQLTWAGYANSNAGVFGTAAPALVDPVMVPADLVVEYAWSATGGGCEVDASTGLLTLTGADVNGGRACMVTLTADRSGYAQSTASVTVTIGKGTQTLTVPTAPYGSAASVNNGDSLEIINAPVGGHGTLEYQKNAGSCTVDGASGEITADASGTTACVVEARWAVVPESNYADSAWATLATIAVVAAANDATPTWATTPYAPNPVVGGTKALDNAITNSGTGALEYRSTTTGVCTIAADGTVTGVSAGSCTVEARFVGDSSKGASAWEPQAVTVDKGVHPGAGTDPYGATASVPVEGTLELASTPEAQLGTPEYSTTSADCSVDSATGVVTGVSAGSCTIQVAFTGSPDYNDYAAANMQQITVAPGAQTISVGEPWGAEPTVGVGATLQVGTDPAVSAGSGTAGDLAYRVASGSAAYCEVGAADGVVTGLTPGDCSLEVMVAASSDGNWAATEWVAAGVVTIGEGMFSGLSWNPGRAKAQVGMEVTFNAVDVGNLGSADVSYRVVDAGDTGCAFKAADENDAEAVRTLTFESRGKCRVAAQVSQQHYSDWDQEHVVSVGWGTLRLDDHAWGHFHSQGLVVGGATARPVRSQGNGNTGGAWSVVVEDTEIGEDGLCPLYDGEGAPLNQRGDCPIVESPVPLEDVNITWALRRGERDCRLISYRTGEVAALPVPIRRTNPTADETFGRNTEVGIVSFVAKTAGVAGDDITVTIEDGTDRGKKYVVTDGNSTETQDNVELGSLMGAFTASSLVDVTVLTVDYGEPDNTTATNLAGGAAGVKSALSLGTEATLPVVQFLAQQPGPEGTGITVTIEDGTDSGKKYTIDDGSGGTPEVYDNTAIGEIEGAVASSGLVSVRVLDGGNEPDNVAATHLMRGTPESLTRCSLVGTAASPGYRSVKSSPIEVALIPGNLNFVLPPQYEDMRINPDMTVQLRAEQVLNIAQHARVPDLSRLTVSYSVQGYNAGTTEYVNANEKADVCSVQSDPTSPTFGQLTGGAAATVAQKDICRLSFTLTDPLGTYNDAAFASNFIVATEALTYTSTPTLSYGQGAKLKIGVSAPLTPAALPDASNASVVWSYVATGYASDGTTPKEGVCRVDGQLQVPDTSSPIVMEVDHDNDPNTDPIEVPTGEFELQDNANYGKLYLGDGANNQDVCEIQAIATAAGYYWYESVQAVSFTVEGLQFLFAEGGSGSLLVYPEELRLSGTAAPESVTTQDDNGIDITWVNFRVVGDDVDGTDATDEDVCSVDSSTGEVTLGSAVSASDTCQVWATATATTAANYDQKEYQLANYTILARGTFLALVGPTYESNGLLEGGSPLAYTAGPTTTPEVDGIVWTYEAVGKSGGTEAADICSIDTATGEVTPGISAVAGDTCEVTAIANANGYAEGRAAAVELTVKTGFTSIAWAAFPTSATVGVPVDLSEAASAPTSTPDFDISAVAVDSGDCTYSNSDILSFTGTTECVVTLTLSKPNHVDGVMTFRVTPVAGTLQIAGSTPADQWGAYGTVTVGAMAARAPSLGAITSSGGESVVPVKTYSSLTRDICSVDNAGAVTGLLGGSCEIKLVLSKTGYDNLENTYTFNVGVGTLATINWGAFQGGSLQVGGSNRNPSVPTGAGANGATISYALKSGSETNCRLVTAATGVVQAKEVDLSTTKSCTIIGTASRDGYTSKTSGDITINLSAGTLGGIAWGTFSGRLIVGGSAKTPSAPTGGGTTGARAATISYALKAGSATNCDLVTAATGEVRAKAVDLSSTKTCTIIGTATRTGYTSKTSGDISITLRKGTQGTITWGSFAGTLEVGGAAKGPSAPTGAGASGATISYALKAGSATNCDLVTAATGEVRAKAVSLSSTKTCTIKGTATRTGYTTVNSGDISIDLSAGTLAAITWGSFTGTLQVGGSTKSPAAPTGAGATGATISYALKAGSATNCDLVTAATGEVRAKAVDLSSTKACTVIGTASRTGYTSKTSGDIGVNLSRGTMGTLTAPVYTATLAIGGTVNFSTAPGGAPAGATWAYTVAGERSGAAQAGICTIDSGTGAVTAGSAARGSDVCIVTATASATGYTSKAAPVARLSVSSDLPIDITWTGYGSSSLTWAAGGVTAPTLSNPTFTSLNTAITSGFDVAYTIGSGTTNSSCSVVASTGVLTINGAGTCQVTLTVTDNDDTATTYVTNTKTVTIAIAKGAQTLTRANQPYGPTSNFVVQPTPVAVANAPTGGDTSLALSYDSTTASVCTVDEGTGALTLKTVGTCTVRVKRVGSANFSESAWLGLISRSIGSGTISAENWGSYSAPTVGATAQSAPTITGLSPSDAAKAWSTTTGTQCSVDESTGALTGLLNGTDNCEVTLTLTKDHYTTQTHTYTVSVNIGTLGAISWMSFVPGSVPTMVVGGSGVTYPPPRGAGTTGATIRYSVVPASAANCEVNAVTGVAQAKPVDLSSSPTCSVRVTVSRPGYTAKSNVYTALNLGAGTLGTLTSPGYSATLRVGGSAVSVSTQPGGTPQGVSATWTYAATGKRGTTATANICSIVASGNNAGRVTPGNAARPNDTCEVVATASVAGYTPKAAPTVTLTVGAGQVPISNWRTYPTVVVGQRVNAPTLNGLSAFTQGFSTSSSDCTLDTSNGRVTGVNAGTDNCSIVRTFSRTHYDTASHTYTFSIGKATMGTLTAPTYSGGWLGLGQSRTVVTEPSGAPAGATWAYSAVGKRSGTVTARVCSVDSCDAERSVRTPPPKLTTPARSPPGPATPTMWPKTPRW